MTKFTCLHCGTYQDGLGKAVEGGFLCPDDTICKDIASVLQGDARPIICRFCTYVFASYGEDDVECHECERENPYPVTDLPDDIRNRRAKLIGTKHLIEWVEGPPVVVGLYWVTMHDQGGHEWVTPASVFSKWDEETNSNIVMFGMLDHWFCAPLERVSNIVAHAVLKVPTARTASGQVVFSKNPHEACQTELGIADNYINTLLAAHGTDPEKKEKALHNLKVFNYAKVWRDAKLFAGVDVNRRDSNSV